MPVEVHPNASAITLREGQTAGKPDVGVAAALDMMWGLDGEQPVVGLIGATYSSVTMPIATVAAVQQVPQISFSATSPALSNKDAYPFFLRTAPPDGIQARAFWSWIVHFDVALMSCVHTVEGYGQGLHDTLKDLARRSGQQERVQGQALRYMPDEFDKEEARDAATSARQIGSRFVMLFVTWAVVDDFLSVLDEEGMLSPEWQIVGSDTCADSIISRRGPTGFMVFRASGKGVLFPEFERLWSLLEAEDGIEAELRQRYKMDNTREPLANGAIEEGLDRGALGLNAYFGFAFDAFYAFAIAINQLLHAGTAPSAIQGRLLLEELRRIRFTGVSGEVTFDQNGDRRVAYELLNMHADGEAVIAAYFSPSSSDFSFQRDLVWMDGSRRSDPPPHLYSCDQGFYKDELSGQCRLCQQGKMCLGGPVAEAVSCPRGSFTNGTGMINCSLCAAGTFAGDIGSVECTPCLPGFEAPVPGMQACNRCGLGSYMPLAEGTQCLPCGKNQITRESGASSETECLCPKAFFMCGEAGCLPCPEGLHCPEGLAPPLQKSGFWAMELSDGSDSCQFSVLRCRDRFECPQGAIGECAFGRERPACNNCKERHFPEGGTCQPCNQSDIMPGILILMLVVVILYLLSISTLDPSLSMLTAASITSQLIMAIQALTSIQELSIQWREPVKTLLNLAKVMTFDLHVIRFTCLYGSDSPTLHFVSQMLACPAACILLLLSWLLSRMLGRPKPVNSLVHNCGVLIFAFFLSITRSTLIPFQCISSPNGSTSMVSHPSIMCYESTEHVALVALAVGGILTQPAAFLGWATFVTLTYPSLVGSGKGLRFANRYRFLFQRFKPEKYYYGLVVLHRSAIVALLPIVLAGLPELQVPLMGAVLLVVNNFQAYTCPWRTASANLVDLILTTFLVLVLLGAAPLLVLDVEESTAVLGWLLCIPIVGILIVAVVGLARAAIKDFRRRQQLFWGFPSSPQGRFSQHVPLDEDPYCTANFRP
ncbi:Grm5 [Symbiodinium sp. CCMP2456]|nr:Grm5 [Symbiodinium sp. CCMP2456]